MDVHLRDLRYFVAVAEELHFTKAAERLFISQPVLSRQVAKLEAALRVKLLDRDRRSVALTAAGQALLDHARVQLEQWDTTRRTVSDAAAADGAVLRVGIHTSVGRGVLRELADRLSLRRPGWRFEVSQVTWGEPSAGLATGDADVAIAWLPIPNLAQFNHITIASEPRHLAVHLDHPLATEEELRFSQIVDEPLVAMPASAGALRSFWLAEAQRSRPAPIATEADNVEGVLEIVASGLGSVLISEGNAKIYRRDEVVTIPIVDLPPAELALVWRTDDRRDVIRDLLPETNNS